MSKHSKIEIRISGVAGSGKSVASRIIARALMAANFEVYLEDRDFPLSLTGPLTEDHWALSPRLSHKGWGQPAEITVCEAGKEA